MAISRHTGWGAEKVNHHSEGPDQGAAVTTWFDWKDWFGPMVEDSVLLCPAGCVRPAPMCQTEPRPVPCNWSRSRAQPV
ncbi:hypothetical protein SKAU_G00190790 [Synaphobranchus kaupii]|uniref:Uncharacterized protein n=1 Tax=Synaphobranchus kaupii TaxID=118154 RepID=A0A9Q1FDY7_SYNKA|nr:hypothetical protein SKAU_G00190790 [Synaphobranchus kaupii]